MKHIFCSFFILFCSFNALWAQKSASSSNGVIATAHPLATQAGIEILENGGNAFDAAVAASFVLSVTEPSMSGLGGRLQALYYNYKTGAKGIDATTQVPMKYIPDVSKAEDGFKTIGIPGMVKGIIKMHKENGILPLNKVLAPAISLAKYGFVLLPDEALRQSMVRRSLSTFPGSIKYFLINDSTRQANTLFKQPQLAKTIKAISKDDGKSFYNGKIAKDISNEIIAGGGFLQASDLQQYNALDAKILRGSYRGYDIIAMGLPCYGAIVIEMLNILEQTDLAQADETNWVLTHAAAHHKAYEDRPLLKKDEDKVASLPFANERWLAPLPPTMQYDTNLHSNGHTTHFVVSDHKGNVVSVTQSLGPLLGSKVASEKHGFLFATTMGPYLGNMEPLERASSHISPVLVFKDGKPVLALGAAGGARIVPAVVQVISRFIDQNLSLEKALEAARVYQLPEKLLLENHTGNLWQHPQTISNLKKLNLPLEEVKLPGQMGRVHALFYDASLGKWHAAADPDWSGTALGLKPDIK
jgi:gamma-glutamyltranspeptidase/glutathione hydrolase